MADRNRGPFFLSFINCCTSDKVKEDAIRPTRSASLVPGALNSHSFRPPNSANRGLWWLDILMKGAETVASQPEKRLIAQLVHLAFPETQGFVKGRLELNPLGSVKGAVLDNATSSLVIVQRDADFVNRGGHRHRGVN